MVLSKSTVSQFYARDTRPAVPGIIRPGAVDTFLLRLIQSPIGRVFVMGDKIYRILKIVVRHDQIYGAELSKYTNRLITISYLVSKGFIESDYNRYGEPTGFFSITNAGREYVLRRKRENSDFIRGFFCNFLSGFLVGVLATVIASLILFKLGVTLP